MATSCKNFDAIALLGRGNGSMDFKGANTSYIVSSGVPRAGQTLQLPPGAAAQGGRSMA